MRGATVGHRAARIVGAFVAGTLIGCTTPGGGVAKDTARDLGPTSQLVTGYIGQQMTEQDRARVRLALDNNSNNQSTAWQGGQGHTPYKVTPIRTFNEAGDVRCRDFDTQATIDGRHQRIRSTACRQSDGAWRPLAD